MSLLDFTDMFKAENNFSPENSFNIDNEVINAPDFEQVLHMGSEDAAMWVMNNLKMVNIECEDLDLSGRMISILQRLFVEVLL